MVYPLNFAGHEGKNTNMTFLGVPCAAAKEKERAGVTVCSACNTSHSFQEPSYGGKGIRVDTGLKNQGAR
jgi:hypothetical protein